MHCSMSRKGNCWDNAPSQKIAGMQIIAAERADETVEKQS